MCTKNHNHTMYATWDTECDRQNFLSFWAIFCPLTPLTTPKMKIWVTQTEFFVILDHFLPFYPPPPHLLATQKNFSKMKKTSQDINILHMCTINDNHMMYGSWDTSVTNKIFCHFGLIFLPFLPFQQPGKSKFWKNEKKAGYTTLLHKCTVNDDHMMYGSLDMVFNRQNFSSFWVIFCLFTPLLTQNIKILKNVKNIWKYYYFTHDYLKWQSYDDWTHVVRWTEVFDIVDHSLTFHPTNNPKNPNFVNMKKMPGDAIILHRGTKNHDHML